MKEVLFYFKKFGVILHGMAVMIRKNKLYFLAPICLILALLALLVYYVAPAMVVSFMYAGV